MLVTGEIRKNGEKSQGCHRDKLGGGWVRTLPNVLACVFSLLSMASFLYLNMKTNDLQGRVWALQHGKSGDIAFHMPGLSMDQLNSIVQEKVDRLLSQRSYEHMAKLRISREAPADCNCPAEPPLQQVNIYPGMGPVIQNDQDLGVFRISDLSVIWIFIP
ncbi:hypothetical protein XELAEV_18009333mg [Xenopus laevis]|uniref:Uncharacterized protein n=1 Tax=Xenopus laevis TaxID=8355 RepID=A0A974DTE6_XENLA|nr:hypothetical protein XELAEV_18009333mg [Xenopus laevis]